MQPIATSVTIVIVVSLPLVLSGCSNKEREEGRKQLIEQAAEQIQAAEQKTKQYDFHAAKKLLHELREEVQGSPYADVETNDALIEEIDEEYAAIANKESDFDRKKRRGWSIVDGKFVSRSEKKTILAEKAAAARDTQKREAEIERQRVQERRRRAEHEKRKERVALFRDDPSASYEAFCERFVAALQQSARVEIYNEIMGRRQVNRLLVSAKYRYDLQRTNSLISPYIGWIIISTRSSVNGEQPKGRASEYRCWFTASGDKWQLKQVEFQADVFDANFTRTGFRWDELDWGWDLDAIQNTFRATDNP